MSTGKYTLLLLIFFEFHTHKKASIAEMSGGWRNKIMQDEVGFIIFESA